MSLRGRECHQKCTGKIYPHFETNPGTPRPWGYLTGPRVCACQLTKKGSPNLRNLAYLFSIHTNCWRW